MMEEAQLRYADAAESAPVRAVNYQPESPTR
jgi:outer membrane phospholipase A